MNYICIQYFQIMSDLINISIKSFRAIEEADIKLNGITVVAGENGCGKSTISRLLYYSIKSTIEYDKLVEKKLKEELSPTTSALLFLWRELSRDTNSTEIRNLIAHEYNNRFFELYSKNKWIHIVERIRDYYKGNNAEKIRYRSKKALEAVISHYNNERKKNISISDFFNLAEDDILRTYDKYEEALSKKPTKIFLEELKSKFIKSRIPEFFNITEYGLSLISTKNPYISIPQTINRTAYIDTPMLLGTSSLRDDSHWNDVEEILREKFKKEIPNDISEDIKSNILNGESRIDEDELFVDSIKFYRRDKSVFDLLDCATGVKSLSIIQMMLDNGFLNSKTLLIMDEPEVHLHPQWIVEYARIIVRLNKELGVKFFIASHSPDMVSAIKYIGEKEGLKEKLNFYLAEKVNHEEVYKYLPLGTDIEPIFKSFNIALDRISLYGSTEEGEDYEE